MLLINGPLVLEVCCPHIHVFSRRDIPESTFSGEKQWNMKLLGYQKVLCYQKWKVFLEFKRNICHLLKKSRIYLF